MATTTWQKLLARILGIGDSSPRVPGASMSDDEGQTDQFKALDVANGFYEHDKAALARLTPARRAEQRRIREQLWVYVDEMWDYVKAHTKVGAPADHPAYSAVAGMRDLASELCATAEQASVDAGDDLDG